MDNLGSKEVDTSTLHLKPWEARIYRYVAAVSAGLFDDGSIATAAQIATAVKAAIREE